MHYEYQLRDYRVKRGEMDGWIEEWKSKIIPLRLRFGFRVVGAWQVGDNRFVWIIGHDGRGGGFQTADDEYYASQERRNLKPDPARHLAKTDHWMMKDVMGPSRNPKGVLQDSGPARA